MILPLARVITAVSLVGALVAPAASAHDVSTAVGHEAEDAVVHTAGQEQALDAHTRTVSAADAQIAAAAVAGSPQDVGTWGPVIDWPVVQIHEALLANGKVLAYDSVGDNSAETYPVHNTTRATVWDPATGSQTPVDVNTGFSIFCSGAAHLFDGRLFIAGGNKDQQLNGIVQTHLFDPATNGWSLGPNMAAARWYPTVTPLRNGEMLITSGKVDTPEVRTLAGSLRSLTTASLTLPLYPWMDVAPDGRAFYSGPDQTLRTLNTSGTGAWQTLGTRDSINRDYGGHAIFDIGKMLIAGGGPSTKDARVVDFNGATPTVTATAPMAFGRRQYNLTTLPDGTVVATGGNSSGASLVDLNAGVYPAELWNPATGQWRTLAAMQVTRQYHSTALLLPDGRVLSGGGGVCGTCDQVGYLAKNAEIFSPPYLFQADGTLAPRPLIDAAPTSTAYGAPMDITTANPAAISKVALIRLGAVTHSDNMEQHYVPLSFTAGATSLTATAPANANVAPPGIYMLFIVDSNGVPSIARMVSVVQSNGAPAVTLTQPANGATFTEPATVDLTATASDTDGTVTKVEFFNGQTKLGEDTTAPYGFTWSSVAAGTYTLTATATDNAGASTTSAPATITVSAGTGPPPPPADRLEYTTRSDHTGYTDLSGATLQPSTNYCVTLKSAPDVSAPVNFYLDGSLMRTENTAPWDATNTLSSGACGTRTFSSGFHTISATWPNGGNTADSFSVGTAPPPPSPQCSDGVDNDGDGKVDYPNDPGCTDAADNDETNVTANQPPTATITSPTNTTPPYPWKPTITITANASDQDGSVTKVEFLDGTTVLGQDTSAPYSFVWRNVPSGTHVLKVRATDNANASATSSPITITVNPKR